MAHGPPPAEGSASTTTKRRGRPRLRRCTARLACHVRGGTTTQGRWRGNCWQNFLCLRRRNKCKKAFCNCSELAPLVQLQLLSSRSAPSRAAPAFLRRLRLLSARSGLAWAALPPPPGSPTRPRPAPAPLGLPGSSGSCRAAFAPLGQPLLLLSSSVPSPPAPAPHPQLWLLSTSSHSPRPGPTPPHCMSSSSTVLLAVAARPASQLPRSSTLPVWSRAALPAASMIAVAVRRVQNVTISWLKERFRVESFVRRRVCACQCKCL